MLRSPRFSLGDWLKLCLAPAAILPVTESDRCGRGCRRDQAKARKAAINQTVAGSGPKPTGSAHGERKSAEPPGYFPQSRAQDQDFGDDFPRQRRQAAGFRELVRQFLPAPASRWPFAIGL